MTGRLLAVQARAAIEAAEAAGTLPTDRAEWLAAAAQDVADGRVPAAADPLSVRRAIVERANELLCVGRPIAAAEVPEF